MSLARIDETVLRARSGLMIAILAIAAAFSPAAARERGSDIWFAGTVLSVDAPHGRLKVMRGPIETAGPAVEDCVVTNAALKSVRSGMSIMAQADTRRRPWRVLHLRIFERRPPIQKEPRAGVAFAEPSSREG